MFLCFHVKQYYKLLMLILLLTIILTLTITITIYSLFLIKNNHNYKTNNFTWCMKIKY